MKGIYFIILLLLGNIFIACKQKMAEAVEEVVGQGEAIEVALTDVQLPPPGDWSSVPPPPPPPLLGYSPNTSNTTAENFSIKRKLIKEANLEWETSNIVKTHDFIVSKTPKFDAYIANDKQYKSVYELSNYMTVKVPADKFDDFMNEIQSDVKHFDRKEIKVFDVTEEYVDVATRIKTKKELEQRYLEILKKAATVADILKVETELNTVRRDIETAEGRMKILNHQISLSTFEIHFYETTSVPVGFWGEIGKQFVEGWYLILYGILWLIGIWPVLLAVVAFAVFIYKRRKKRKLLLSSS
jgi:hypothetical protein